MKLSEYIAAWEDGEIVEIKAGIEWVEFKSMQDHCILDLSYSASQDLIRIRPKLKPVDMSVFVGSGVDCEFSNHGDKRYRIDQLCSVQKSTATMKYQAFQSGGLYLRCKPRMNYWFSGRNFDNPVKLVEDLTEAGFLTHIYFGDKDEVTFKIEDKHADRFWPWEIK